MMESPGWRPSDLMGAEDEMVAVEVMGPFERVVYQRSGEI
jgi:hypothetical protein